MGIYTTTLVHIFLIVTIFSFFVPALSSLLQVAQQGVYPVEKGDVALIFYANLSYSANLGDMPIAVRLEMEKCCLKIKNGADCESMKLIGGPGAVLRPKASHMLQMYFVNPDLLDREGNCTLHIISQPYQMSKGKVSQSTEHREWTKELDLTITFNTILPGPSWVRKIWISLGGSSKGFRMCEQDDNPNAIHECANQNCLVRFAGKRSLSNATSNQCDNTPTCNEDNTHMSPKTGKCGDIRFSKKIRETFSSGMLTAFSSPLFVVASQEGPLKSHQHTKMPHSKIANKADAQTTPKMPNIGSIACGHGVQVTLASGMNNCTCQSGWTSQALEEWHETFVPGEGAQNYAGTNEITAVYKMCTVPTDATSNLRAGLKGHILVYLAVVAMIFIILYLIYLTRQRDKPQSTDTLYYHSMIGSSSTDEEGEITDTTHQQTSDDETDGIITEIANRREPVPSKSRSHHDHPPQPPPSSPSAGGSNENETRSSIVSFHFPHEHTSQNVRFENAADDGKDTSPVDANERLHQFSGSSEPLFSPSRGFNPQFEGNLWPTDANLNRTVAYAKRTPSMDEILNLSQNESLKAHVPLAPAISRTTIQTHSSTRDINMNRNDTNTKVEVRPVTPASCVSSEALITQKKKEEWAQFMTSISEEKLASPISNAYKTPLYSEVESDEEKVKTANKVQSLPQMPNPPASMIQKAIREMDPADYKERQLAFRVLSSLSTSCKFPSPQRSQGKPSTHSIWSNVASENAIPPEPDKASRTSSFDDVRTRQIYGDLGSDNDTDDALESIAISSSTKSKQHLATDSYLEQGQLNLNTYQTDDIQTRPTVADIFEQNQKLHEDRQNQIQQRNRLLSSTESMKVAQLRMQSDNTSSECYLRSKLASTAPTERNSWRASNSSSDTMIKSVVDGNAPFEKFPSWVHETVHSKSQSNDKQCSLVDVEAPFSHSESQKGQNTSPETQSAYRIKSALQTALKASRSRSGHSFF